MATDKYSAKALARAAAACGVTTADVSAVLARAGEMDLELPEDVRAVAASAKIGSAAFGEALRRVKIAPDLQGRAPDARLYERASMLCSACSQILSGRWA